MNEEVMKQIFLPFFTTKDIGHGTGLGLSVVHGIITSHGGTIHVNSKVHCGTRFEIRLPVTETVALRRKIT
jgi:signal transduction histidine kinase